MSLLRSALFLVLAAGAPLWAQAPPEGRWQGAIEVPGQPLAITVDLVQKDGAWVGTIDIPAQGARNARLSDVAVNEGEVGFAIVDVPGEPEFSGKIEGAVLAGTFRQGGQSLPFRLTKVEGVAAADLGPNQTLPSIEGVPGEGFVGVWLGVLETPVSNLRLLVRLEETDDGFTGSLDSLDQGAIGLRITSVEITEKRIEFKLQRPSAGFEGMLNEDGSAIEGKWKQGGGELPLTLYRQAGEPDVARAQEPKRPYPYREEEVIFENESAGVRFAGTLTLPPDEGPFPALALLTGSGPQDRNETVSGHKPFLVIADALTRRGYAVLRFDDRGVGGSSGDVLQSTIEDFASDARAALAFLRQRPEVDPERVGLLGHSEGAAVATLAATEGHPAFLVLLAHPGLKGEDILYLQGEKIARAAGQIDQEVIDANRAFQRRTFEILREEADDEAASRKIRALVDEEVDRLTKGQDPALAEALKRSTTHMATNRWFRSLLDYDPVEPLDEVDAPMLFLFGERDVQVPPEENIRRIREQLGDRAERVSIEVEPKLNHLFQESESGSIAEYSLLEQTISPAVLERIGEWLDEHAKG